jgi:basic membrane protein A
MVFSDITVPRSILIVLMIVSLGLSMTLAYLTYLLTQTRDIASELKELVEIGDKQRIILTHERYDLDNFTEKSLTQGNSLLVALTKQNEKLLELQPLLFNDLNTNRTGNNSIPYSKTFLLTDAHFNDQGWGKQGLDGAKAVNATATDSVPIIDIVHSLIVHAAKRPELIIAQGFQWADPVLKIAPFYKHIKFVVMTGLVKAPNVASIYPQQQQGGFILGAIAAMLSKTHVIGFVGGQEYPNIINVQGGYVQGAHFVDPNVKVLTDWTYDFNNESLGRQIATNEINQGADFVLHVADTSGQGVIQAANARGVHALGSVADQNNTLTSFVIDMKKAYKNAPNYTGIVRPGLETGPGDTGPGIIYIAPFHQPVPPAVAQRVSSLVQGVINGSIVVPERSLLS